MKFKRIRTGLLAIGAAAMMFLQGMSVMAAEKYTYTVTISPGNKGVIRDAGIELVSKTATKSVQGGKLVITNLSYNDRINVSYADVVSVTDEKYYAKVLRESGRDNGAANISSITVTDDRDYVVGYGTKGDQVAYTVNYVDENGVALGASNTYYGNVGDRPVIAYRYFEGYLPQAYNLTKTLVGNEAENVFTFTYREMTPEEIINYVPAPAPAPGTTTGTGTTGTGTGTGTAGAGTDAGADAGTPGDGVDAGTPEGGGAGTDEDEGGLTEVPDENTPQDLVDLDDEQVPLANIDADGDEANGAADGVVRDARNPVPLYIGIGAAAVVGIAAVVLALLMKKRRK